MPNIQIPARFLSNLSQADQITELNNTVRCKLGVSKIEGVGVIAMRNIQKGERCYITPNVIPKFYNIPFGSLSKLLPEVKELVLQRWASIVNGSIFQSPNNDAGLLFFVNHSENPNYDVVSDTALKDIRAEEEVLEDYRAMQNWQLAYPDLEKWTSEKENQGSLTYGIKRLPFISRILSWINLKKSLFQYLNWWGRSPV